jgi:hypothetical protein
MAPLPSPKSLFHMKDEIRQSNPAMHDYEERKRLFDSGGTGESLTGNDRFCTFSGVSFPGFALDRQV